MGEETHCSVWSLEQFSALARGQKECASQSQRQRIFQPWPQRKINGMQACGGNSNDVIWTHHHIYIWHGTLANCNCFPSSRPWRSNRKLPIFISAVTCTRCENLWYEWFWGVNFQNVKFQNLASSKVFRSFCLVDICLGSPGGEPSWLPGSSYTSGKRQETKRNYITSQKSTYHCINFLGCSLTSLLMAGAMKNQSLGELDTKSLYQHTNVVSVASG